MPPRARQPGQTVKRIGNLGARLLKTRRFHYPKAIARSNRKMFRMMVSRALDSTGLNPKIPLEREARKQIQILMQEYVQILNNSLELPQGKAQPAEPLSEGALGQRRKSIEDAVAVILARQKGSDAPKKFSETLSDIFNQTSGMSVES